MTNTISISFELSTNCDRDDLGFEAWIDNVKFIDPTYVQGKQSIKIDIDDVDGDHELRLILKGKKPYHTQIDEQGNILKDATISISDLAFDEIKLGHMVTKLATYSHDFNGTKELVQDQFYGEMGCNGVVSLRFTTPIYLWLLENM
jgi:hypothetical protein